MRFDDKVIVLTGVGREGQVGEVVARAFAEHGARVAVVDVVKEEVEARASALRSTGHDVRPFTCDLTDAVQADALAREVAASLGGRVDALVNAAGGFAMSGPVAQSDPAAWPRMFAINLTTAYLATRAFLPALRRARGAVVYFASAAVLSGRKIDGIAAYAAAKSGVVALMRAVADEERDAGVRANALAPTSIRTAANVASMGHAVRYVERDQVADAVLFLCSDAATAISGQTIVLA
jgi:NAD(P)-dependent dehydrogenase (short-subunit alcohol dehydrogenase family)